MQGQEVKLAEHFDAQRNLGSSCNENRRGSNSSGQLHDSALSSGGGHTSHHHLGERDPGTTALVVTVIDHEMHVVNIGDSRMVVAVERCENGNTTAIVGATTTDHNARSNAAEAARVVAAGGCVDCEGYVGSMLELSRTMGDFRYAL